MRETPPDRTSLRVDKWLWFARLAKTRSLAARLCAAGAVRIAGAPALKAHQAVRVGDIVRLPQGRLILTVRVRALGTRRGPAAEARLLYEEHAPPLRPRAEDDDWAPLLGDAFE
ncbi:MAG: RNA-binding S4 domain-containing protein [Alphaproteobacteria bacterium]|nr:RNA-binding S4 domain-containing protein [Alphaproteobacteria bacterium]